MPIVSNTSPILNLAIINELVLLKEQFDSILIPQAVEEELRIKENLPGCDEIKTAIDEGWIKVLEAKDKDKIQLLNRELDKGEAEAITLALQVKANMLLVDEREARTVSKSIGLKVTGIIGVILKAYKHGQVESIKFILDELINKAGFRIRDSFYNQIIDKSSNKFKK